MSTFTKTIAFNERSYHVALLHQVLAVLGLPVAEEEVAQQKAGSDTRSKVRALQKERHVAPDETTLVNDATVAAIKQALQQRGLATASRAFIVTGTTRLPNGTPKKRQRLLAFDLDLRAVAVYRTVQTLAEIRKNGGFELLGHAVSDNAGNYRITFYDWQYRRAERKKADVVVYAIDEEKYGGRLIGRSRLVDSNDYSAKGLVADLDVLVASTDERTEYEIVMSRLGAFLKESDVSLRDIATSSEQLAFTASELDLAPAGVTTAAAAELLIQPKDKSAKRLSHELLYGIGRQNIALDWPVLYKKPADELRAALEKSAKQRIIRAFAAKDVAGFLALLHELAVKQVLDAKKDDGANAIHAMLSTALPKETQRVAFLHAVHSYAGSDFRDFWSKHLPAQPEFKDDPQLAGRLLYTQQLTLLTGNHQALVKELQVERKLDTPEKLLDLEPAEWLDIIKNTGVPEFVEGKDGDDRARRYAEQIEGILNAAFPTQRIARMVARDQLPIEKNEVSRGIGAFLAKHPQFDVAVSRVGDFDAQIEASAGAHAAEVKHELMKIQRAFQVSTSPRALAGLLENDLDSGHAIANIPRKSFIKTYANAVGGEAAAYAIHQRASHVAAKAEIAAMHTLEYVHNHVPRSVLGDIEYQANQAVLQKHIPNYTELFGSPDICECAQCRSVYSAAAYFVDLLRFLWRGDRNADNKSPLDLLGARRPDLVHLPLTCENTNTLIPYVDLANEVMEYYTAHDSLANFKGYNTGDATAAELRANPQNFNLQAYRNLKDAKYPFTLPYHQPLDVIRTYSDHLKVSRYEAMRAVNPQPNAAAARAIAAESLRLAQEEYQIIAGENFNGVADATALAAYFGYGAPAQLENLSAVPEFLRRSGVRYTDLVELVKTQLINPYQATLDFLQQIFAYATISATAIYARLGQIAAGALNPANDAAIVEALTAYNAAHATNLTPAQFGQWVTAHLGEFRQVITLYEPDSKCDLETTKVRTIQSIYDNAANSGVINASWSKIHRFIRLWRKLGWTLHETDSMLAALGASDIAPDVIGKLESVVRLKATTKLPINQLAVLWGNIDTYGSKSLYKKLFLNKAVQQIDDAFKPDAWGNYLQDAGETLAEHQSAILAALRLSAEDLAAIFAVAKVIDGGNPRLLDPAVDALNLANLSTIYRHAALAKALKLRVGELCKLIALFGVSPFSAWDVQQQKFVGIAPDQTAEFVRLAEAVKTSGFKAAVLEYILQGALAPDSTLGLTADKARRTAKAVRDTFDAIEQDHPLAPATPLTADILTAKLALTFQSDIVNRFIEILKGSATFDVVTGANLNVVIPPALAAKYTYIRGSGRLTSQGVVSDNERAQVKALSNSNDFKTAVDALYEAPEQFIATHFSGVFANLAEAKAKLLNHPAQAAAPTLEEKLEYVYARFIPILKGKLRRDAITQHIATLIGLSQEATGLLIEQDIAALITDLSTAGFSASYFNDANWTNTVLNRTDAAVDFDWGAVAPDPAVPANNFSVRWQAHLAAPASGEYTLVVNVAEADEAFKLYLDDVLILEKAANAAGTSREVVARLNAAGLHRLRLDYAEAAQNAGVRLQWKTATRALEVIPAAVAYPAAILDRFVTRATTYHRAAKFVAGFALSETELSHFLSHRADFGNIDFQALRAADWRRISDYVALRNAVPQAQALLTDVFAAASRPNPAPTVAQLKTLLTAATAWDRANLDFLVDTHFALVVADFKNEIALNRVREIMRIAATTGLSASTIAQWGKAEIDFDRLNDTAQLIKNTVKAKYEEDDWLDLAGELSDGIRERQKQALVAHLLTRPAIQQWGVTSADGLFEYFLIDVQMCACMDTSRIVQASAAIQMFVNRCLLNLESRTAGGLEHGVSPGAIDQERWEWMKNYRVWEANRKIFLYPENWLEPEWRNDRSAFFKDLESYLVQNDITDRSVEQAFRNYLASVNEVANLEVCGTHRENYDDGKLRYLHVFARTHNAPYKFYYRRWDQYRKWSAWEKVALDIRSVENGFSSGVHLIPVVWKKRLFLFWPEFALVQDPPQGNSGQSVKDVSDDKMSALEPDKYWELRLAWGEYVDGKWTPKQLSKESVRERPDVRGFWTEKDLLFTAHINAATQELYIFITDSYFNAYRGEFILTDIQSSIYGGHVSNARWNNVPSSAYQYFFNKRWGYGALRLMDDVYLKNETAHKLLPIDTMKGLDITLEHPFFFTDDQRSYFVRPVDITIVERVKNPTHYEPVLPGLIDDYKNQVPDNLPPHVGPDDYMPGKGGRPPVFGGGTPRGPEVYTVANAALADRGGALTTYFYDLQTKAGQPAVRVSVGADDVEIPMTRSYRMRRADSAPLDDAGEGELTTQSYALQIGSTGKAFGGNVAVDIKGWTTNVRYDTGLEFHSFHHPYSSTYVKRLNQSGLPGLMQSDTALPSDNGSVFEATFDPNFSNGFVQKPADFAQRTYYKENVCFDVYGANSIYNWELFFHAPLYIATRLSKNGKYAEAMKWFHYIFDPTTDETPAAGQSEVSRYWKVLPFKTTPAQTLEDWFRTLVPETNPNTENAVVGEWRDHPFDPHRVASNRPLAYMKHVVIQYVENLVAWGDFLFRQFTRESVNEALQLYVIANHILGPRPEFVPKRGEIKAETYDSLKSKWDSFSNALVALENIFPYSSEANVSNSANGTSLLGVGTALYFCIPPNDKLMDHWNTVADRLYKIRHCQDIDGVERKLALFAPPIEPGALVQAASQGLSLGSILADLSSPPPIYRFTHLIQKANEFCADVKALGSALLAALEKKDAEELGRLRASQETQILELTKAVRERQVLDAKANKENLLKARDTASFRLRHYIDLLGNEAVTVPAAPTVPAELTADSALPPDTVINTVTTDVDAALADSDERGVKLIPREQSEFTLAQQAADNLSSSLTAEIISGFLGLLPQFDGEGTPLGVGAGAGFGGRELGWFAGAIAKSFANTAQQNQIAASKSAKMAGYIRREQEWTLQANLAAKEIVQLDKQLVAADIRIQVAQKELANHVQQIENAKAVEQYLQGKFTNQELYQWMKEQLYATYKQAYNLAFDMAKKAEKAYRYETGTALASFIQYGYWDNTQQGLVAGEKLQLALRQLENSYLDENRRELELNKSISLARLDPLALIELRETGKCFVSLPEELFDLDFRGHYFRRIKTVRLSIPCVAGPYTSVSCTLRLLNGTVRINTGLNADGNYERTNDEGLPLDDDRFRTSRAPVTAIATSLAQNDAGVFEFNFRDERYLPFERAGAISEWQIELSTEKALRQFDYATITDVILHLNYSARENGGVFKDKATTYIKNFIKNVADLSEQPLMQLLDMRHEFPTEWYRFLHPAAAGGEQLLKFTPDENRFPFFAKDRRVVVEKIEAFAKCTEATNYHMVLSYVNHDGDPVVSDPVTLEPNADYGGLQKATLNVNDAGLNLEELDIDGEMTLKLKRSAAANYTALGTNPDELQNLFLVLHYKLADA